jgi:3-mercaptopyruvate sulfurtransferase SseA
MTQRALLAGRALTAVEEARASTRRRCPDSAWFALTYLLGREHVRVYDESWAQWGRADGVPVAHGHAA